jgi:hypothetical protein
MNSAKLTAFIGTPVLGKEISDKIQIKIIVCAFKSVEFVDFLAFFYEFIKTHIRQV